MGSEEQSGAGCLVLIILICVGVYYLWPSSMEEEPTITSASCVYKYYSKNIYTCDLFISGQENSTDYVEINGVHLFNRTDADVQAVIRFETRVKYFNGEVLRKFENLKSLEIDGPLMEINENAFDVCPKLEILRLNQGIFSTKLTTFPSGMLKNCANLVHFNVIEDGITSVPEDLFGMINNLETFTIKGNLAFLPEKLLQNMDKLEEFKAVNNQFHDTKDIADALNGRTNLKLIWLIQNGFTSFDFDFFSQFHKLETLRIESTKRHEWTQISWHSLPDSLKSLVFSGIGENIPENSFSQLRGLNELTISGYGIDNLHKDTFKPLINLSELVIELTNIKSLPSELFSNLINLKKLTITNTQVHRLNADSFGYHSKLQDIDFSNNKINEIQRGLFSKFNPEITSVNIWPNECVNFWSVFLIGYNLDENESLEKCFKNWEVIPDVSN